MWCLRYPGSCHPRAQSGRRNHARAHTHTENICIQTPWIGIGPIAACGCKRRIRNHPCPVKATSSEGCTLRWRKLPLLMYRCSFLSQMLLCMKFPHFNLSNTPLCTFAPNHNLGKPSQIKSGPGFIRMT